MWYCDGEPYTPYRTVSAQERYAVYGMYQEKKVTTEMLEAVASNLGLLAGTCGLYSVGMCTRRAQDID